MINSLLDIVANQNGNYYFDGKVNGLGEALIYALIGFVVVFVGIVLIIFIIWLLGLLMRKTNNLAFLSKISFKRKKKPDVSAPSVPVTESTDEEISPEVRAAIISAVISYLEQEAPQCEFKVKRIKRI